MNVHSPSVRHGFISLSVLILLFVSLYLVVVAPALAKKAENRERMKDLAFQSVKFNNAKSEIESLKKEIERLNEQSPDKVNFLKDDTPAIVAADLQKQIKALVESSGGDLISTHALPQKEDELFPKITIKVHLRTNIDALRKIFYQITVNRPLLFTDNILLQQRNSVSIDQQTENIIEVRIDISGYINPIAA